MGVDSVVLGIERCLICRNTPLQSQHWRAHVEIDFKKIIPMRDQRFC